MKFTTARTPDSTSFLGTMFSGASTWITRRLERRGRSSGVFALSRLEDSTQQAFVWSGSQKFMEHMVVRDDETGTTRYEGALALPVSLEGETAIGLSVLVNENDPLGREGMLDGPQGYSLTPRIGTDSAI